MGPDVVHGRGFEPGDTYDAPGIALVTASFAARHFPAGDVVGRRLVSSGARQPVTVIGVIEDHLSRGIDKAPEPAILLSLEQRPLGSRSIDMRTGVAPVSLTDAVREAVWSIDRDVPVYDVRTMQDRVAASVGNFAILAQLMGGFALVSLVLGAVGIYGVASYGVTRRSVELGVRMAMGGDGRSVVTLVLSQGLRRMAIGLVLGTALALMLTRAMAGILFDVSPADPLTFAAVTLTLGAVGLLGSWLPARRAATIDPVRSLSGD